MSFDALWVCGLDGAQWPMPAWPDPFLPREWQARQRIPGTTAEVAAENAQRLLERLCRSAGEVILSVPQFDGDAPLLPSELLGRIPRGEAPESWRAPVAARLAFDTRPELESLSDAVMPPLGPVESARGGARLLEVQSSCPFRAQAEFRLGARALEEPEIGVAASERGDLVHNVLARIWRELRDQRTLSGLPPDELAGDDPQRNRSRDLCRAARRRGRDAVPARYRERVARSTRRGAARGRSRAAAVHRRRRRGRQVRSASAA